MIILLMNIYRKGSQMLSVFSTAFGKLLYFCELTALQALKPCIVD